MGKVQLETGQVSQLIALALFKLALLIGVRYLPKEKECRQFLLMTNFGCGVVTTKASLGLEPEMSTGLSQLKLALLPIGFLLVLVETILVPS